MTFENILFEIENNIGILTINRPDKLNALNQATLKEIGNAIDLAENSDGLKGLILTGSGEKAFVAGADISEFQGLNVEEATQLASNGQALFFRLENFKAPVIACVNGLHS